MAPALRLLLVCRANLCRSPMAEAVFGAQPRHAATLQLRSAGLAAATGLARPASVLALLDARGYRLPADGHARRLDAATLRWADLVLVMESAQRLALLRRHPEAAGKVWRIGHWRSLDIADPAGQPAPRLAATLDAIEACAASWPSHFSFHCNESTPPPP